MPLECAPEVAKLRKIEKIISRILWKNNHICYWR